MREMLVFVFAASTILASQPARAQSDYGSGAEIILVGGAAAGLGISTFIADGLNLGTIARGVRTNAFWPVWGIVWGVVIAAVGVYAALRIEEEDPASSGPVIGVAFSAFGALTASIGIWAATIPRPASPGASDEEPSEPSPPPTDFRTACADHADCIVGERCVNGACVGN